MWPKPLLVFFAVVAPTFVCPAVYEDSSRNTCTEENGSCSGSAATNENEDTTATGTTDIIIGSEDDSSDDPSEDSSDDDENDILSTTSPIRRYHNHEFDNLSKIYLDQLEHIDQQLHDEIHNHDPIITCDDYLEMDNFIDPVAISESLYQEISWAESTEKPDKCLTLDDTLQICDSYRPHYHEYFVHFPASFLPQRMKRAIFIGGGDSMLLHELLKYPSMELIVGLELDQIVVRDSLKHFFTRPHFELYPKVQWWFGDAAKSLLLLPKEWYNSFDLVLVDLSETVMSLTVSEELDILKALALLLNPHHGIFVKNERYLEELSDIFDHVIQIYLPDTPLLCDQDWVFGSYGIDFLHPDFERNRVPTFHYRPSENASKHYELIRDYAKNSIDLTTHCKLDAGGEKMQIDNEGKKKVGLFMAVEAENAVLPSLSKGLDTIMNEAETMLVEAIKEIDGLHIEATQPHYRAVIIVLREGYIVARLWHDLQYCALDIVLWSRSDLVDAIREALLQAVGVTHAVPTYKVVVGGLYGTDTWREDLAKIGPKKANMSDCKVSTDDKQFKARVDDTSTVSIAQIVAEESLALSHGELQDEDASTVVFCGLQSGGDCESLKALLTKTGKPVTIWACTRRNVSGHITGQDSDGDITLCDQGIYNVLQQIKARLGKLHTIVIDNTVPYGTVIDVANALTKFSLKSDDSLISEHSIFILPKLNHIGGYFLEICRLNLLDDLLRVAVVTIDQDGARSNASHLVGYLSIGNSMFLAQIVGVMVKISERASTEVTLVKMKSSPVQQQTDYDPHHYTMFDYDEAPGMDQYSKQLPLGKQTLLQIKVNDDMIITEELLTKGAEGLLKAMNVVKDTGFYSRPVGDGMILHSFYQEGNIIVVWSGRQYVDVNLFSYDETVQHKELFEEYFMKAISSISTLTLWDEQPRGVGRVINFSKDIVAIPGCIDRYILCDKLEEFGECEVESEKKWMYSNCPLACDQCPGKE